MQGAAWFLSACVSACVNMSVKVGKHVFSVCRYCCHQESVNLALCVCQKNVCVLECMYMCSDMSSSAAAAVPVLCLLCFCLYECLLLSLVFSLSLSLLLSRFAPLTPSARLSTQRSMRDRKKYTPFNNRWVKAKKKKIYKNLSTFKSAPEF